MMITICSDSQIQNEITNQLKSIPIDENIIMQYPEIPNAILQPMSQIGVLTVLSSKCYLNVSKQISVHLFQSNYVVKEKYEPQINIMADIYIQMISLTEKFQNPINTEKYQSYWNMYKWYRDNNHKVRTNKGGLDKFLNKFHIFIMSYIFFVYRKCRISRVQTAI